MNQKISQKISLAENFFVIFNKLEFCDLFYIEKVNLIENLVEAIPGEPAALWREINLEIAHGHITKIIIIVVIWIMLTMIVKLIIINDDSSW